MRKNWTVVTAVAATLFATILTEADNAVAAKTSNSNSPKVCPKKNPSHRAVHVPHEWDCTKFYTCDHGRAVLFECPAMDGEGNRLYFNEELEVCDWPDSSGCVQGTKPTTRGEPLATTQSTTRQSPTWSEIFTQSPSVQTTTTPAPTTIEPTTMPTTIKTTLVVTTQRPVTTPSPASTETSTEPATTPTAIKTTVARVTTELHTTRAETSAETTCTPTTIKTTEPNTSTEPPSTTTSAEMATPTDPTSGLPCDGVSHGSLVSHECLCDKYYRCSNGDLILNRCPSGLHFNPRIYSCDNPDSAGCLTTTPEPITDRPSTGVTIPSQCPPDNSGGTIQFPHPTNCSLFYKCDNGEKKLMQCPNGLYFNPTIQMCDWPESAGCLATSPVSSSETPAEPTTVSMETSTKGHSTDMTTVTVTTPIPTECPKQDSESLVQLPHPYNCSLYYVCQNGEKILQSCPPGLEFNPQERVCDWPEVSGCTVSTWSSEGTQRPTSATEMTTNYTTLSTTTTTTTEMTTNYTTLPTTTTKLPTECPDSNSGKSVLLPHPHDCSLYYICENGKKIVQSCPPGLEFNAREQVCDWPNVAGCVVSTTEPAPSTTSKWTTTSVKPTTETSELPNTTVEASTTTKEWSTSVGSSMEPTTSPKISTDKATSLSTIVDDWDNNSEPAESSSVPSSTTIGQTRPPKTTMEWITSTETSSTGSISSERPNSSPDCPPGSNGLQLPHETNCSLYYECNEGNKTLMECTPGLHFSPALEVCVWPEIAGCQASTISTDSSSSVTDDDGDQESSSSSDITYPSTTTDAETIDPSSVDCIGTCPVKDPSDRTILLPHKNCTKFCKCSNSRPYVYECPADLHFSPELFVCDYPEKAKCLGEGGSGRPQGELDEQYTLN